MTMLNRYVLAEVLKVFAVALGILTLVILLVFGIQQSSSQGLEPRHVARIIPYLIPDVMRIVLPAAILFAVSHVFGRMAGSNEIVALKSLGISPLRVLWPTFGLALVLSFTAVGVNELALTWGRAGVRRVVVESIEEIAYGLLRSQDSYSARNFSIIVERIDGRKLVHPTMTFQTGEQSITLQCEEAELRSDTDAMFLTIVCRNGTLDVPGQARLRFHDTIEREIPLDAATPGGDMSNAPSHLPLVRIPGRIDELQTEIHDVERKHIANSALWLMTGEFGELSGPQAAAEESTLEAARADLARLRTELPRRWSSGFSCLCFVMIGAPMAIWRRNSDFLTSFFLCFGPILVIYYPLLMLGVRQAKTGDLPPLAVWLGNVILMVLGCWLLRRVVRY